MSKYAFHFLLSKFKLTKVQKQRMIWIAALHRLDEDSFTWLNSGMK